MVLFVVSATQAATLVYGFIEFWAYVLLELPALVAKKCLARVQSRVFTGFTATHDTALEKDQVVNTTLAIGPLGTVIEYQAINTRLAVERIDSVIHILPLPETRNLPHPLVDATTQTSTQSEPIPDKQAQIYDQPHYYTDSITQTETEFINQLPEGGKRTHAYIDSTTQTEMKPIYHFPAALVC